MITEKQFTTTNAEMVRNGASDKALYRYRSIYKIASNNWQLKKFSVDRWEIAKKIYNTVKRMWHYKDLNLEYDSLMTTRGEKLSNYYSKKEDKEIKKIKPLIKKLNLKLTFSTFAHIEDSRGNQII